jgi:hypothetical protein
MCSAPDAARSLWRAVSLRDSALKRICQKKKPAEHGMDYCNALCIKEKKPGEHVMDVA